MARLSERGLEIDKARHKLDELEQQIRGEISEVVAEIRSDCAVPAEVPNGSLRFQEGEAGPYSFLAEIPGPSTAR